MMILECPEEFLTMNNQNEEITMRKYYAKSTEVDFSKMTRLEVPELCQ